MRIERRYTKAGRSPYADIAFRTVTSEIRNPDGSVVFRQEGIEVPEHFSQVASDILRGVSRGKYMIIWRREEGQWKLHRDIFNSSMPAPT